MLVAALSNKDRDVSSHCSCILWSSSYESASRQINQSRRADVWSKAWQKSDISCQLLTTRAICVLSPLEQLTPLSYSPPRLSPLALDWLGKWCYHRTKEAEVVEWWCWWRKLVMGRRAKNLLAPFNTRTKNINMKSAPLHLSLFSHPYCWLLSAIRALMRCSSKKLLQSIFYDRRTNHQRSGQPSRYKTWLSRCLSTRAAVK